MVWILATKWFLEERVKGAYGWMVVGKCVIDAHVLEEPFYVLVEESLDFAVVELRVDKEGTNEGLHDVGESLKNYISNHTIIEDPI